MSRDGAIESLPAGAGIVHLGDVGFVSPWPEFRATPSQLARLEIAGHAWELPLMAGIGPRLVAEIEAEMAKEQRRREKTPPEGRAISVRTSPSALRVGFPALFVDGGHTDRVILLSDAYPHEESGEVMRLCSFLDQAGEEYEVKAGSLEPCDDDFSPLQAEDLATPRSPRVGSAEKDGGRVYAPEPMPQRSTRQHPIMEKFDRIAAVEPMPAKLLVSTLSTSRQDRIRDAEKLAASRNRHDRQKGRALMYAIQQEVQADAEVNEILVGRNETVAQAKLRRDPMRVDPGGVVTRKTGLETLLISGAVTAIEVAAGDKYAVVYEKARASLKVANWEGAGGGGSPSAEQEQRRRQRDLDAQRALTELNAYVQAAVRSPRAITALRLVAGEGRHVSHFSKGAGRAKNVEALQKALAALADRWGLT